MSRDGKGAGPQLLLAVLNGVNLRKVDVNLPELVSGITIWWLRVSIRSMGRTHFYALWSLHEAPRQFIRWDTFFFSLKAAILNITHSGLFSSAVSSVTWTAPATSSRSHCRYPSSSLCSVWETGSHFLVRQQYQLKCLLARMWNRRKLGFFHHSRGRANNE